ncbi:MAG TPA: carboxypeptidase-like regulatory domain-containing protein [Bryobacteraceae bacterium]|nr:carboxypeptidase-like regulatory domain-containing protein [Bryobacteraceae bacterium]
MKKTSVLMLLALVLAAGFVAYAQAPTGTILGSVKDESGAVIPNGTITITNKATNIARTVTTNQAGLYSAPALQPGEYEVRAEVQGFRTLLRDATVFTGGNTTVDMAMAVGEARQVVSVEAATGQVNYETNTIQGVIERQDIQDLPLNGRSALQLAGLEPGVTVVPGSTSQFNGLVNVSVFGDNAGPTAGSGVGIIYTLDGGTINDEMEGGISLTMSQEIVQESQLSQNTFDLSTGIGASGALNIVTRSGSNDFHGNAYFYFRDHNMAAYPLLARNPLFPDPFFVRRNPGATLGGPIKKDKLFFFFNYEYFNQVGVDLVQEDLPSLQGLNGAYPEPYHYKLINTRFDYRLSPKNTFFVRYTHDGNTGFGPYFGTPLPSNENFNYNWSDQSILGLTTVLTPALVSDFRFQYHYWQNNVLDATAAQCQSPCIGTGLPSILTAVPSATFLAGTTVNGPQLRQARSLEFKENMSWQKATHRFAFGIDYEHMKTKVAPWDYCDPGCDYTWSPEFVRGLLGDRLTNVLFPDLPTKITSNQDLLNLPVLNLPSSLYSGTGVGNGTFPGLYNHDQGGINQRIHPYFSDSWKVRSNLTVNYGLGYDLETGLFYSDIPLPHYLAPILQGQTGGVPYGLGATQPNATDFAPQVGFAWAVGKDKKTVIRGGGGIYWDTQPIWQHFREGAAIGPPGDGRTTLAASAFTNTIPGIIDIFKQKQVPIGAPLPLGTLTTMTLGQFLQVVNQEVPALQEKLTPIPPKSGPFSVSGIDIAKQGVEIYPSHFPLLRSYQTNIGVQRDLGHDMVVSVDWARRQGENTNLGEIDLNRFQRYIDGVRTPVIPFCTGAPGMQAGVPGDECSTGPMTFWLPEGRSVYDGLLVKLNKRFSHRYYFIASYAMQKSLVEDPTQNLGNYFAGYGPNPGLPRHQLDVAGSVDLPWGFKLSMNSSIASRTPVEPLIPGVDILGNETNNGSNTALSIVTPKNQFNCFGYSCGKSDLVKAVQYFNANWAGKTGGDGNPIPTVVIPPDFQFSDPTFSQDFRVTKQLTLKERYKFSVFGEFFNAFNVANLQYPNVALDTLADGCTLSKGAFASCSGENFQSYTFGQPTNRTANIFGSGGPRVIQIGGRFDF